MIFRVAGRRPARLPGYTLAVLVAVNSVIALFYYLRVVRGDVDGGRPRRRRHAPSGCRRRSPIALALTVGDHPRSRRPARASWPTSPTPSACVDPRPLTAPAPDLIRWRRALDASVVERDPTATARCRSRRSIDAGPVRPRPRLLRDRAGPAGRRGDFLTSPEVGPLFGAVLARALDAWWDELGRPDPFMVVEAGAGPGTLARSVLLADAGLRAGAALRAGRALARAAGPPGRPPAADRPVARVPAAIGRRRRRRRGATPPRPRGTGRRVVSLAELPAVPGRRRGPGQRAARQPAVRPGRAPGRPVAGGPRSTATTAPLVEHLVPAGRPSGRRAADGAGPRAADRCPAPVQRGGRRLARRRLERGSNGAAWWWSTTPTTGADGRRARGPSGCARTGATSAAARRSAALGSQDITCEVAARPAGRCAARPVRRPGRVPAPPTASTSWWPRAGASGTSGHIGDLAALRARSRVGEAEALTDPAGLGAFGVFEWSWVTSDRGRRDLDPSMTVAGRHHVRGPFMARRGRSTPGRRRPRACASWERRSESEAMSLSTTSPTRTTCSTAARPGCGGRSAIRPAVGRAAAGPGPRLPRRRAGPPGGAAHVRLAADPHRRGVRPARAGLRHPARGRARRRRGPRRVPGHGVVRAGLVLLEMGSLQVGPADGTST